MNYERESAAAAAILPHNLILEDRKKLSITGVTDVGGFDEQSVCVKTELGELTVRGEGLHITRLSLETGDLSVEGSITSLNYSELIPEKGGFFSRVFR